MNQQPLSETNHLNGKRLMILGGSLLQIPAINEARSMGIETAVLDYNPNCPGRNLGDRFYLESTYDEEAVLRSALDFQPDGIITLGTDWPMRSVAYACSKLGLRAISYEAACHATNKLDMIEIFSRTQVAHPDYLFVDTRVQSMDDIDFSSIPLPCIMKPVDSSGSRGVVLIQDPEKHSESLHYSASHSKYGQVLIEEYMTGPEVSVEVIILSGIPHVLSITDKVTTGFPYFVETRHTQPSRLPLEQQKAIQELAIASCRALNLTTGAAHVEIIHTAAGPKIVEVGPRMGGDFIATHLVYLSTGINMTRLLIEEALGMNPVLPQKTQKASCIGYIDQGPGRFLGVEDLESVRAMPHVQEVVLSVREGEWVRQLRSSQDRMGHIITWGETPEEAQAYNLAAHQRLQIRMEQTMENK